MTELNSYLKFLDAKYKSPNLLIIGDFNSTEDEKPIVEVKASFRLKGLSEHCPEIESKMLNEPASKKEG